jgi:hypothetical protein
MKVSWPLRLLALLLFVLSIGADAPLSQQPATSQSSPKIVKGPLTFDRGDAFIEDLDTNPR